MAAVGEGGADRFRPHFLAIEMDDMVEILGLRFARSFSRVRFVSYSPSESALGGEACHVEEISTLSVQRRELEGSC